MVQPPPFFSVNVILRIMTDEEGQEQKRAWMSIKSAAFQARWRVNCKIHSSI
jgi:hypothetical protein